MIKVSVVDGDVLRAQRLVSTFRGAGVAAEASAPTSRGELLAAVAAHEADVVLLNLDLGEPVRDGVSVISPLQALGIKVLVMTGVLDRMRLFAAVEAGADGLMDETAPAEDLLDALHRLMAGEQLISDATRLDVAAEVRRHHRNRQASQRVVRQLTVREREVLTRLADGHTLDAIAEEMVVPTAAVRLQLRGILSKLGVGSQVEAVALAQRGATIPQQRRSG